MTFIFKYSLQGATPQVLQIPSAVQANVTSVIGINSSGYIDSSSDATAATLVNIIGITEKTVDNSGGSAGDLNTPTIISSDCVYEITSNDTMAQAQVYKTVAVSAAGNTAITSNSAVTNSTGTVKTIKFVSASLALGIVLHAGPMA